MKITILRGNQIGGCITQIESKNGSKIQIDCGHNLPKGDQPTKDKFDNDSNLRNLLSGVSDLYYSHYHGDHIGFEYNISKLGVQQHIGKLALNMLCCLRKHQSMAPTLKEDAKKSHEALDDFATYKPGKTEKIGDIEITPYYVSHSAIDAYMFLIHCDEKYIIFTGDFRDHGYMGKGVCKVIESLIINKHIIDVLITEGTMLARVNEKVMSEMDLQNNAKELFNQYKYAFVLQSSMDVDRFTSFYQATKKSCKTRLFIADNYQQQQINIVTKTLSQIYCNTKTDYIIYRKNSEKLYKKMSNNGFTMLVRVTTTFEDIIDQIIPYIDLNQTVFIYSEWSGYINNDSESKKANYISFTQRYKWHFEKLHTSGHASKEALEQVCTLVLPKSAIVPIHKDPNTDFRMLNISQDLREKVLTDNAVIDDIDIRFSE